MPHWTDEQIATAAAIIDEARGNMLAGDRRAFPLPLFEAIMAATVQPACEAIIVNADRTHYWLQRRPADEQHFGPHKLHVMGGIARPGPYASSFANAQCMAQDEMGFVDVRYAAGPIATYQWTRSVSHPYGNPLSQVYVCEAVGAPVPMPGVECFDVGYIPPLDDFINYPLSGEIHRQFVEVFHDWLKDPDQPCIDLNINW